MNTKQLIESKMKSLLEAQDVLVNQWQSPYIDAVEAYMKSECGREVSLFEKRNIAQCLENAFMDAAAKSQGKLFEATTEDHISFLGIQLPVIAALVPTLVLNEIATTQSLDRRTGSVFYMDAIMGQAKGSVANGDTLIAAKTGHGTSTAARRIAEDQVHGERIAVGNGPVSGTLAYAPGIIRRAELQIVNSLGVVIGTSNALGVVTGSGASGTIGADGSFAITISGQVSGNVTINYFYQYDMPVDANNERKGVAEIDINLVSEAVTASDFTLRSRYSLGAALDLQKAHGINLESELVKYLGGEIKFSIDQTGLDLIDAAAVGTGCAVAPTAWDAKIQSGQEWLWKKYELLDRFEEGSNNIWSKTLRAVATWMHVGNNVARVLKQMPEFKASGAMGKTPPTGPVVIGEIGGRKVIQNPWKSSNTYVLGYKGDNFLMAGFVYLPYIPMFTTPTLITSDIMAQKGFMSSAAFKVVNPGMFCQGVISGLATQTIG